MRKKQKKTKTKKLDLFKKNNFDKNSHLFKNSKKKRKEVLMFS